MKPFPVSHCPVCKQPLQESSWPFCSARCKDIDLGRWFTGAYAIPVEEEEEGDKKSEGAER